MEFSRQEYWSGSPFPTPGNLPNPGIELMSFAYPALAGGFFTIAQPGKPKWKLKKIRIKKLKKKEWCVCVCVYSVVSDSL